MPHPQRILFVSGTSGGGTARYRIRLAQEALALQGVASRAHYFTDPKTSLYLPDADVLALYRVPATPWLHELARRAGNLGIPVTYDIDDLVFRPEHLPDLEFLSTLSETERAGFYDAVPKRAQAAHWAGLGSGTTEAITSELAELTQGACVVVPNGVGKIALARADEQLALSTEQSPQTITLGYFSGSNTHDADWKTIESDIVAVMRSNPQTRLLLVGDIHPSSELSSVESQVQRVGFRDWQDLFELLTQVDVNLVPLTGNPFTAGKSAIKWLEAALVETPTIATATPPHQVAITGDENGVLIPVGKSWIPALQLLIDDFDLRSSIGKAARIHALTRYGPQKQSERYVDFFSTAIERGPSSPLEPAPYQVPKLYTQFEEYPFVQVPSSWNPSTSARIKLGTQQLGQIPGKIARRVRR